MKDDYITIRCEKALKSALRKAAKEQERTLSGVVNNILKRVLKVKK